MTYQLRVPGPTPVPERIQQAMATSMVNHRGPVFRQLLEECRDGLKWAFQTRNEVVIFPASGTGGLEAAVTNLTSPGEKAVFVSVGQFGDRMVKIGRDYGVAVVKLESTWGQGADLNMLATVLDDLPDARVVFVTHNETSTGVTNDIRAIAEVVKSRGRLLAVDGVSSVSAIDLPVDELKLDVVVSGSQKGWMLPPGMTFLSVSEEALRFMRDEASTPRHYFDINRELTYEQRGQTYTTPAVSLMFGLQESLRMLREEGLQQVFARHARIAHGIRQAVRALELELLVGDPRLQSNTVTAVLAPQGDPDLNKRLIGTARDKFALELAGGQGKLEGRIFRIGHLGDIDVDDARQIIMRLEQTLLDIGYIDAPVGAAATLEAAMSEAPAAAR